MRTVSKLIKLVPHKLNDKDKFNVSVSQLHYFLDSMLMTSWKEFEKAAKITMVECMFPLWQRDAGFTLKEYYIAFSELEE